VDAAEGVVLVLARFCRRGVASTAWLVQHGLGISARTVTFHSLLAIAFVFLLSLDFGVGDARRPARAASLLDPAISGRPLAKAFLWRHFLLTNIIVAPVPGMSQHKKSQQMAVASVPIDDRPPWVSGRTMMVLLRQLRRR